MAFALEFLDDNPFKAKAYERAARSISGIATPIEDLIDTGGISHIEGIGKAIAATLTAWVKDHDFSTIFFGIATNADPDGDGLSNYQEFQMRSAGYNPTVWDSNTNGVSDGYEDYSGDGLANLMEAAFGGSNMLTSNPGWKKDTDGDGLPDSYETMIGLNPNSSEPRTGFAQLQQEPHPVTDLSANNTNFMNFMNHMKRLSVGVIVLWMEGS